VVLAFPAFGFEVSPLLPHLAWVALVPLLLAATGAGAGRGLLLGASAGLILEGAGFLWILLSIRLFGGRLMGSMGPVIASLLFGGWLLYAAVPWALLGAALGSCRRRRGPFLAILFWVGVEHYFPRLWPWHLGGALYGSRALVQCADLLGASGLTALVLLVNVSVYLAITRCRRDGRLFALSAAPLLAAAVLVALAWSYGVRRLVELERLEAAAPALDVLIVQGCLDPGNDMAAFEHTRPFSDPLAYYTQVTRRRLLERPEEAAAVDLILWPEGADHRYFNLTPGIDPWRMPPGPYGHSASEREALLSLLAPGGEGDAGPALVTGSYGARRGRDPVQSNIAAYLRHGEPPLFYEKNVLVPFGERVPLDGLLPLALRDLFPVPRIAAGTENPLMPFRGGLRFRNLLCYEAILPGYVPVAAEGADFLVNLTEDMWYGRSAHISQHVSVLVLRVIENRTPLLRATNVGPSGAIGITGDFQRGEQVFAPALLHVTCRAVTSPSFYQRAGRYFPLVALVLAALGGGWHARRQPPSGARPASQGRRTPARPPRPEA
jgi:apolipoprotein N-acyltransferase